MLTILTKALFMLYCFAGKTDKAVHLRPLIDKTIYKMIRAVGITMPIKFANIASN